MINYKIGDALKPETKPTIICHIVNSVNAWGAGFVVPLAKKWDITKREYHKWYNDTFTYALDSGVVDHTEGHIEVPFMLGESQIIKVENDIYVANMLAQKMGTYKGVPPIRYEALHECLHHVVDTAQKLGIKTLSGCKFGSGLSGGSWKIIEEIINEVVCQAGLDMDIYELPQR